MKTVWKAIFALLVTLPLMAQEKVDWETMSLIRMEALGSNSKAMEVLNHLTDEIGPRLTNSPNMKKANEYTRDTFTEWGLANAHLEAWGPFGRGWSFSRSAVHLLAPRATPLQALPKAWTPGTDGPVTGEAVIIKVESEADLEALKGTLGGKIVFLDEPRAYEPKTDPGFERYTHAELDDMCHFDLPEGNNRRGRGNWAERFRISRMLKPFLKEEGVLATINISSRDDGIIRVTGGGSYDPEEDVGIPDLVMAAEHYNLVARKLQAGEKVELTVDVQTQFYDEDLMGYNTIAEIPGSDLKGELVMAGAHLDSWHAGTGALDNGVGVAMVMEAARILKALDLKPRRTVRFALWSGEEQGLMGSRAHVEQHFADFIMPEENGKNDRMSRYMRFRNAKVAPKPAHDQFSAYFNLDNGGGKIRGIYTQGNAAVQPIFEAWLAPFKDLGATHVTNNDTGGTDHQSFDRAGLPGFQFIQDPLSYSQKNHHTHLDVYDHVVENDVKQAAGVLAAFIYQTAMRDEKLPRKPLANRAEPAEKAEKTEKKKGRKGR